jgi:hypothetical protein
VIAGRPPERLDSGDGLFLTYEEILHNYVRKLAEFRECPITAVEARSRKPAWLTMLWALQKLRNLKVNMEERQALDDISIDRRLE